MLVIEFLYSIPVCILGIFVLVGHTSCRSRLKDLRRWSVKQLRDELTARSQPIDGGRFDLIARLRAHCKDDKLCCSGGSSGNSGGDASTAYGTSACSCVAEGVPCHPQACGCSSGSGCCNPEGVSRFDAGFVAEQRKTVLEGVRGGGGGSPAGCDGDVGDGDAVGDGDVADGDDQGGMHDGDGDGGDA